MRYLRTVVFSVVLSSIGNCMAAASNSELAAKLLIRLCLAGGLVTVETLVKEKAFSIEGENSKLVIESKEISGFSNGLNSELSNLSADQANRARKCIEPYRDRIMDVLLGPEDILADQEVKRVSKNIEWRRITSENPNREYDTAAYYVYVYKNYSNRRFTKCKLYVNGARINRTNRKIRKFYEYESWNIKIRPGDDVEIRGSIRFAGQSDKNTVLTVQDKINCW
jgi:hypothetical protein